MKNPAVVALCQIEISLLASVLSASFLPQHFPRHSPKLPEFYSCFHPSNFQFLHHFAQLFFKGDVVSATCPPRYSLYRWLINKSSQRVNWEGKVRISRVRRDSNRVA